LNPILWWNWKISKNQISRGVGNISEIEWTVALINKGPNTNKKLGMSKNIEIPGEN